MEIAWHEFLFLVNIMQVQTLCNPEKEQFRKVLESNQPNFVYLQGEQLENEEVGSLVWQGVELSTPEAIAELFGTTLPTAVCILNFSSFLVLYTYDRALCCYIHIETSEERESTYKV